MENTKAVWPNPATALRAARPERPVAFFSPRALRTAAQRFLSGFPGLVTYAVKANPDEAILTNLAAAGVRAFDVASPAEIDLVAHAVPGAAMHYNNPVRSPREIADAVAHGVRSFSVDSGSELEKLAASVPAAGTEVAVRFKLPVKGAAYDFGDKFGAHPGAAAELLRRVEQIGFTPSLTFHPGTQCTDPAAWASYIAAAADIADVAGVTIARLNVGGGFPAQRAANDAPPLAAIFETIENTVGRAFGGARPGLVCEPGRALVAGCLSLAARVKAVRDGADVFLNDGVYGGLLEQMQLGPSGWVDVLTSDGTRRGGTMQERRVFGPTCDSLDRLPGHLALPQDIAEGDYILFHGVGAYSTVTATRFNGYGDIRLETVDQLPG